MTISDGLHAYGQLFQLAVPLLYMWHQPEFYHLLEAEKRVRNQVIISGKVMDIFENSSHDLKIKFSK